MDFKKMLLWSAIAVVVAASVFWPSYKPGTAQAAAGADPAVTSKIDTVLQNQRAIMADLASIKEELRIIKIRVTQAQ
jgi:hypothetical protein